jgi:HAD superfamily hydrolase (TIGR01509 family)
MPLFGLIEAVILDMDGTLHDTESVYLAAMKQAVAGVGFEVSDSFCYSLIGIPGKEGDELLRAHLGPGFPFGTYDQLYSGYCRSVFATRVPLKPGVHELLDWLTECELPVAIATSASRDRAEQQLERSGLRHRIPMLVTRDDVDHGKPHPDLFLRAAALLGVLPDRCLAVEDSINGIHAAHAAGMMPVMVPDLLTPSPDITAICVAVASDLHDVRCLLSRHRDHVMHVNLPSTVDEAEKTFSTRQMAAKDLSAAQRLLSQLGYPLDAQEMRRRFDSVTQSHGHILMVAEQGGFIVALCHVYARPALDKPPEAVVQALIVDQGFRGKGVGKSMMSAAERWAADQGFASVALASHVDRLDAHAFYKGIDYQCDATSHLFRKILK